MSEKSIELLDADKEVELFGVHDKNIKKLEESLNISISSRNGSISISGKENNVDIAYNVIEAMMFEVGRGEKMDEQRINYIISIVLDGKSSDLFKKDDDIVTITSMGKPIKGKTLGQKKYIAELKKKTIVFSIGPAGTGKTYLAVAMAVEAFRRNEVDKIILTRPAVEAGESLGFLPGDLQTKVDPYLRPLYDSLFDMLGAENFHKYLERGAIEVAPLAYMRGRTLDNAYIILDEAQNTTSEQMKMFLTRLGANSKMVVTGDITQIDLVGSKKSGLKEIVKIVNDIKDIGIIFLTNKDVVRHILVQKIIEAYDKYYKE